MVDLDSRINLLLREFERVPTMREVAQLYLSHFPGLEAIPQDAMRLLSALDDASFRDSLEERIVDEHHVPTPEQENAVYQIAQKRRTVLPYGTGAGKTYAAIAARGAISVKKGNPVQTVVISPKRNGLKRQWSSRIWKYSQNPEQQKVVVINNEREHYSNGVPVLWDHKDRHSRRLIDNADFIIVNYHMIPKWKEFLPRDAYGIIDEAHNIGNGHFIAPNVKALIDPYEYVVLSTASPIPNSIRDIGNLINLISKEPFKIPPMTEAFTQIIRSKIHEFFVWPSYNLEDTLQNSQGKKVRTEDIDVPVDLSPEHRAFYQKLFETEVSDNDLLKLTALREAALDPELLFLPKGPDKGQSKINELARSAFPEFTPMESSMYARLAEIAADIQAQGEKFVVYSDFVTGVTDKVSKMLGERGIPATVLNEKDADQKRALFQIEPELTGAIGSYAITEGAPYFSASNGIFLHPFYEDYRYVQGRGRLLRPGQEHEVVKFHHLFGKDTIHEGIVRQTRAKGRGIRQVLRGVDIKDIDRLDIGEMLNERITSSKTIVGYLNPLHDRDILMALMGALSSANFKNLEQILEQQVELPGRDASAVGGLFADLFNENFERSYQANVARAYSHILENFTIGDILDAAGGSATASRILWLPATIVDINQHQLEIGRLACEDMGIQNTYIHSPLQTMDVPAEAYDTAIYSLAFDWGAKADRPKILKLINRSLKPQGTFIMTLPSGRVPEERDPVLREGFGKAGFEVAHEYTGHVVSPEDPQFSVYILTAQKVGYGAGKIDSNYFDLPSSRKGKRRVNEGTDIEDWILKELRKQGNGRDRGSKPLYSFQFENGRALGSEEQLQGNLLQVLGETPYRDIERATRRMRNSYDPKVLYRACETLVQTVDTAGSDLYPKIDRMFDLLAERAVRGGR